MLGENCGQRRSVFVADFGERRVESFEQRRVGADSRKQGGVIGPPRAQPAGALTACEFHGSFALEYRGLGRFEQLLSTARAVFGPGSFGRRLLDGRQCGADDAYVTVTLLGMATDCCRDLVTA